jgi:RNA polymerase sigma factor (sigma-70 family)
MRATNPLAERPVTDPEDLALVTRVQAGSRQALETLIHRHQPWIYNILVRMLYHPDEAEDATQEVLIKVLTKLSTFEACSSFRTWLYRIVVNHALNVKRRGNQPDTVSFSEYARGLDETPDLDLPDPSAVPADVQLLVQEAKTGCTSGMLLCLDREQRLVYILGAILGVPDTVGAELLEVSRDAFRQKLARVRRGLHSFVQGQCGLVDNANPCRCAKKTQGFIKAGYLDPHRLLFARAHVTRVREMAPSAHEGLQRVSEDLLRVEEGSLYPALHRMEQMGLLRSEWGVTEKNREARFYSLTAKGRRQLSLEQESWSRLTEGVGRVLRYA